MSERGLWDRLNQKRLAAIQRYAESFWEANREALTEAGFDRALVVKCVAEATEETVRRSLDLMLYGNHMGPRRPVGILGKSPIQPAIDSEGVRE
jgi:hypothetical protein